MNSHFLFLFHDTWFSRWFSNARQS